MRGMAISVFVTAILFSPGLSAQDRGLSVFPGRDAKWQACYEESRLMHRTRNLSLDDYREDIKDARRSHMRACMTKVQARRN
jgi:hypothetical protein